MTARTALIAGASGLVGREVLTRLLESPQYQHVLSLGRRKLPVESPKLTQVEVDFDKMDSWEAQAKGEDVFCCVGTTMAKAHTQDNFYAVDFDIPYELARAAKANGARRFLIVTAQGADPDSKIFYSRVKGEIEQAVAAIGFEAVEILRPSLLLGERGERRTAERLAAAVLPRLSFLMVGPLKPMRPIHAHTVADAMLKLALSGEKGVRIHPSDRLQAIAGSSS